jgi:hypothetical protein
VAAFVFAASWIAVAMMLTCATSDCWEVSMTASRP